MRYLFIALFLSFVLSISAGNVRKSYTFGNPIINNQGNFQTVALDNTLLSGKPGEPTLPWHEVALMLPPGEAAIAISISGEELTPIPGVFTLYPQQNVQPLSIGPDGNFLFNESVYQVNGPYPLKSYSHLTTHYLNGYGFALSTFTPVIYNPVTKTLAYYKKMTVSVTTQPTNESLVALQNLTTSENALKRVRLFTQNPEMMEQYPSKSSAKSGYQILIITSSLFQAGFDPLIAYYEGTGATVQLATTQDINTAMSGADLAEKIRNYIIQEYQTNNIENVILGGDVMHIPYRGFYCYVVSGTGYEDDNIPADLYYSALDGTWNNNGNSRWGEPGEDDLLPDVAVGRMSFSNATEQTIQINKSISYQGNPVTGELNYPFLVGEYLYDNPTTFGQDYLELLVNDHTDNGYFTHGMNPADNIITRLYDTTGSFPGSIYSWDLPTLLEDINEGKSFIHHSGHSNADYMMRLNMWDITNDNFAQVNGVNHNYTLMYTHGCICGAFDVEDCISEKSININNFLVAGVFNSRYGWFNQGQTEGPSAHLHREFVSAMYNDTIINQIKEIGAAHAMSKIKTAPWVGLPGEFEPGAQRWCHYDCNVLGDPALKVWTEDPSTAISEKTGKLAFSVNPNPAHEFTTMLCNLNRTSDLTATITNTAGQKVYSNTWNALPAGNNTLHLHLSGLVTGLYFLHLDGDGKSGTLKLILVD